MTDMGRAFFDALAERPEGFFALLGALLSCLAWFHLRRVRFSTRMLMDMAMMLALAVLLHQIRLYHAPQGGSVTAGGMIPLLFIAFRYGAAAGALEGFLFGTINIVQDPFILHPVQVLFDYPLPYMAVSLAAAFPRRRFASALLAFAGRFACHFISGVVFFSSYAPAGMHPALYSLAANAAYLVPECALSLALLKALPVERLLAAMGTAKTIGS